MSDRELLELAAKAAGIEVMEAQSLGLLVRGFIWNPLTDDGDALRLAVKLKMLVSFENGKACALPAGQSSDDFFEAREKLKPEPYAATRRAIVRAAAEIGKAMQPGVLK